MLIKIILSILVAFSSVFLTLNVDAVDLSAKSSVLIEADSKEIVLENNAYNKMPMASTTKIMTSLIAIESGMPSAEIKTTDEMLRVEGTSMGLKPGDTVTLKNLVYGMLLESGNDAANVVAYKLGGNPYEFSKLMNKRAEQIGMKNSHFVTPSGLDAQGHYSTAYDMALLGAEAIDNPEFRSICSTKSIRVSYGNPPYMRTLTNHNSLLKMYPNAIGIKTGFTKKSKRCLVSAAEKDGVILVAVTLNACDDWNDHVKMYDYGFSKYKSLDLDSNLTNTYLDIVGSDKEKVKLKLASKPKATVHNDENREVKRVIKLSKFEYAPIEKGKIVGSAQYYIGDKLICETPIVTAENAKSGTKPKVEKKSFIKRIIDKIKG